jgi:DNA-binding NtrC family response regulator
MPFDLQTRLLRVLSDGSFYRVGGHSAIKANVRVIAATHQDLELRVQQGAFREDLFHRLNVIRLRLPALRERREDIPMLTRHFLQHSAKQLGVEPKRIADSALAAIEKFAFPGNVRQLENVCHWLTVMAPAQVIEPKDLPPEFGVFKRGARCKRSCRRQHRLGARQWIRGAFCPSDGPTQRERCNEYRFDGLARFRYAGPYKRCTTAAHRLGSRARRRGAHPAAQRPASGVGYADASL